MKYIKQITISLFSSGHQRSIEAKKNILASLFIKGLSILISLIMVPLTIHYINPTQYGIWLTLSSMVTWISFFDIGFTQGLRNNFAKAKAKGDKFLARNYVSTAYLYLSIIFFCLWIILIIVNNFIDWSHVLNIDIAISKEVSTLATIIFTYFSFQFVFRIINTILIADQKPAIVSFLDLIGQALSLLCVFLLTKFTSGSLIFLGLALGVAPTLIIILANVYFFKTNYQDYSPSIKFVKKECANGIMNLGFKFFILQMAAIVQYQTILFLIAHYFDTLQVTAYNIAYKYFGILQMVFMILVAPLWSGVTEAYNIGDKAWIKNIVKKYLYILIPFIILGALMLFVAQPVYNLWLGRDVVNISFKISLLCYIFFTTGMFASIFVFVINGVGALRIQFFSSIITSIFFIIISLTMIKILHYGIESIMIASIAANVYGYIIAPIQYYKLIISKNSSKIWHQ
ncbi:MAG: hypothetical protein JZU47_18630 [Prolixibacteraceae bacterium]|nr:hypothetical protein [Prolixibacteraceae bacterium]